VRGQARGGRERARRGRAHTKKREWFRFHSSGTVEVSRYPLAPHTHHLFGQLTDWHRQVLNGSLIARRNLGLVRFVFQKRGAGGGGEVPTSKVSTEKVSPVTRGQ
jgi:hypothetical protein